MELTVAIVVARGREGVDKSVWKTLFRFAQKDGSLDHHSLYQDGIAHLALRLLHDINSHLVP